ncbi:response regulator transcription factor [Sulfurimonas sp. SAG-AH-194-C21]|nr:response regulator transcription factor [Sulfurimonas sp. SAG-AH-194-C21]MDF1882542.1 response regulator transcription factor [Sulfurimonas sp. SAG-AH-194-C21]
MARILLLEDDITLGDTLQELLESEGYEVSLVTHGQDVLDVTASQSFELMLFDVNVPDFNGFELLKLLRDSDNTTPCIFLTSLNDIASLSKGFEVGADDYLKKPFDFDELLVRIKAVLRKYFHTLENEVKYKNLLYKITTNELFEDTKLLSFAPQEKKLIALFFKNINTTITKEDLLFELSREQEASEGALRVYITKLRKVGLEIETIKGTGYRLVRV